MYSPGGRMEGKRTVGVEIKGERKYIRYVEFLKEYKDEKFFNKTTTGIAIYRGKFANERCEIVDEETDIFIIERNYARIRNDAYSKWRAFGRDLNFVINGEFDGKKSLVM